MIRSIFNKTEIFFCNLTYILLPFTGEITKLNAVRKNIKKIKGTMKGTDVFKA